MVKYIQQKQQQKQQRQQRQQHQNLFCQFIQLNITLPRDVMGLNIPLTPQHPNIPQASLIRPASSNRSHNTLKVLDKLRKHTYSSHRNKKYGS